MGQERIGVGGLREVPAENEFLGGVRKKENEQLRKSCMTGNELSTWGKELALCRGRLFFSSLPARGYLPVSHFVTWFGVCTYCGVYSTTKSFTAHVGLPVCHWAPVD